MAKYPKVTIITVCMNVSDILTTFFLIDPIRTFKPYVGGLKQIKQHIRTDISLVARKSHHPMTFFPIMIIPHK